MDEDCLRYVMERKRERVRAGERNVGITMNKSDKEKKWRRKKEKKMKMDVTTF